MQHGNSVVNGLKLDQETALRFWPCVASLRHNCREVFPKKEMTAAPTCTHMSTSHTFPSVYWQTLDVSACLQQNAEHKFTQRTCFYCKFSWTASSMHHELAGLHMDQHLGLAAQGA